MCMTYLDIEDEYVIIDEDESDQKTTIPAEFQQAIKDDIKCHTKSMKNILVLVNDSFEENYQLQKNLWFLLRSFEDWLLVLGVLFICLTVFRFYP